MLTAGLTHSRAPKAPKRSGRELLHSTWSLLHIGLEIQEDCHNFADIEAQACNSLSNCSFLLPKTFFLDSAVFIEEKNSGKLTVVKR
jgi:hypothetical protein